MSNSTLTDVSFANFQAALSANALLAMGFLAAFVILRPLFPLTYAPRLTALPPAKRPNLLTKTLLSVFWVVKTSDKELLERCGHDAFAAIFYTRTIGILFLAIALPAAILLIPINATGGGKLLGLNQLTQGNVADHNKLWAHFFFTVYVCGLTLFAIFRLLSQTARLRQNFQTAPSKEQSLAARTLMARDVPREWRNEDALKFVFNRICPDSVEFVVLPANVPYELSTKTSKELTARNNLESAVTTLFATIARTDPHPDSPSKLQNLLSVKKVEPIAKRTMEFRKARENIDRVRSKLGMDDPSAAAMVASSTAFIVFREPFQANLAAQATIHDAPAVMSERIPCVSSKDIVWETANMNYFARQWRSLAALAFTIWMAVFWAAIVSFILLFANLDKLGILVPVVKDFVDYNPSLAKMIGGILPPLIQATLIGLVPTILRFISVLSGSPLQTRTEQDVLSQYFLFQLCNVVFVNIVGSSLITSLAQIKDNPSSILSILSTSIPQSATSFVQYMLVTGMTKPSGEILQLSNLILNPIMSWLFGRTPRTLFAQTQPPEWRYADDMGAHGITISIGLIFCVVAPVVSVFAAIYFGFYYAVYLYQFQYVYVVKNETGGKFLFVAASHMFVGLFIMEFMLTVLFSVALNFTLVGLMLFIVAITLWSYSQARSFLSIIDSIPVKTMLDMEGEMIPINPTTPFRTDETLTRHFSKVLKKMPTLPKKQIDSLDPDATRTSNNSTESDVAKDSKLATNASKMISYLIPGQDSSKYTNLISFFLPGLVSAIDSVPSTSKDTNILKTEETIPETLFAHPKSGHTELKVWIPDSTSAIVTRTVSRFIFQDEAVISRDRIVHRGAWMNEKGKVVLMEGMYEEMEKL
ncbi:hypothetical protein HDU98_006430 [Podochytrium sp. JEL0797]|nr:hypothetical protein HDU98_006430 [Podochytrium sp. JEL0797]